MLPVIQLQCVMLHLNLKHVERAVMQFSSYFVGYFRHLGPFLCVTIIENVGFACDFQKVSGALVEELIMTNNKVIIKFKKE